MRATLVAAAGFFLAACAAGGPTRGGDTGSQTCSLIEFYRGPLNRLEAVRSGSCPMHPSCSEYSRQAFARHGAATGWVLTLDRLMRCGRDEVRRSPRVWVRGDWKVFDPLSANDYWWWSATGPDSASSDGD